MTLEGVTAIGSIAARTLTASAMQAHNTFDHPEKVEPGEFQSFVVRGAGIQIQLPPMSVTVLEIGLEA